ncbi:MAG: hypothetical protein F6K50_16030 [Moorea sp. SIO3I7]|uniref:hypothetical protein n=1 Tax=unclassified Moorena TaxID=2683338 RepID=UPI0013BF3595|nr:MULTISPECIES: hypothetical protein [unclassified Moorena]NEN96983.1 hypothetical protein [Moorena sp. SIO3I7]NEO05831.1 hypothetical protein [Moorena sp. SIO3I8]NEP22667.1 hypothetical protein [Moorena sp. SIO3I6]
MSQHSSQDLSTQPLYSQFWTQLKQFPKGLASGSKSPPTLSGPAAAALLSAAFSCFLLMVNQHLTSIYKVWNKIVWDLGGWIPGSRNPDPIYGEIGSYSGKETVMLVGWLLSWFILAQLWQNRQVQAKTLIFWLFTFIAAATIMNWHPIFPYLPLMPK